MWELGADLVRLVGRRSGSVGTCKADVLIPLKATAQVPGTGPSDLDNLGSDTGKAPLGEDARQEARQRWVSGGPGTQVRTQPLLHETKWSNFREFREEIPVQTEVGFGRGQKSP